MKKITVIGLGKMGAAMATRILEAGFSLTVFNRTQSKAQALVEKGAMSADSIQSAVADADIILSSLLDDQAMLDVTTGKGCIIENMQQSAIHIGMATILPETAEKLAIQHQEKGGHYVSAAVMGVPKVAAEGGLTTFCAGDESIVAACEPVFKTFSKAVINLGDNAKAPLVMKICMNYSLITALELISELYVFAEKSGLDKDFVQSGLNEIFGHPAFKLYVDKIKDRNFDEVNFDMKGGIKDVSIFQKAFSDVGVKPKLADLVKERYVAALENKMEDKDWSAIYEIIRKEAGLE
jgi:3-hydroxyisobutyrate dehydrogenase-like beta-hydroxyacid dehydrogenase